MEFDECDYCKAWASMRTITNPEEEEISQPRTGPAVFSIITHVTFLHLPLDSDLMDDDDPDFLHLVESRMEDGKVEIECNKLRDETTRRRAVEDMLTCMHVPLKPFMVDEILTCALRMLNDTMYANHKVLQMEVQISLYVDELPLGVPILVSDDDEDDEEDDLATCMVPASKSSIDKLERVEIQEPSQLCSICLESFSCGFEATRMPCSHLFHGGCIERWLITCNSCPLCRSQMS